MRERPIPFTGPMVKAILEGRKTQTRRMVKFHKGHIVLGMAQGEESKLWVQACQAQDNSWIFWYPANPANEDFTKKAYKSGGYFCPYGQAGDRLWVREHWAVTGLDGHLNARQVEYKADRTKRQFYCDSQFGICESGEYPNSAWRWNPDKDGWCSSLFMPRWASRINLEIVSVQPERLQSITEEDAEAEGLRSHVDEFQLGCSYLVTAKQKFRDLWDYINGKKCPWDSNPWVWRIEFKRLP